MRILFHSEKNQYEKWPMLSHCFGRGGKIYVEPCEGLPLEKGSLIELVAPVYGLNDAPLRWHKTLADYLVSIGFRKSLLDPCLYVRGVGGNVDAMVIIEGLNVFI